MLSRVCAAQMARTIVRALHVQPDVQPPASNANVVKPKTSKPRKKRKAA